MLVKMTSSAIFLAAVAIVASATKPTPAPLPPAVIYPPPSAAETMLLKRLPEVRMKGLPLDQAIAQLREQTGANFVVRWRSLEAAGISRTKPVEVELRDVTLAQALAEIRAGVSTDDARLSFEPADNLIVIATMKELSDQLNWKIYDVQNLIAGERARRFALGATHPPPPRVEDHSPSQVDVLPDPTTSPDVEWSQFQHLDQIVRLITDTIDPEGWREAGGIVGSIREVNGRFVVVQTWENHQRIAALLEALRITGLPSPPPSTQPAPSSRGAKP